MERCWLCGRNGTSDPLDTHHVFGGSNRKKSEQYGLVVRLCHKRCHIFGPEAAHVNRETMQRLHEWGQKKAMAEQGWTIEEFRWAFGKNYLTEEEAAAPYEAEDAFEVIEEDCEDFGLRLMTAW